jgi:hypothetical protein
LALGDVSGTVRRALLNSANRVISARFAADGLSPRLELASTFIRNHAMALRLPLWSTNALFEAVLQEGPMKRSINRWTTTVAMAAVLGLPVVGFANTLQDPAPQQQPQPTQPESTPPQAEPAKPQPTEQQAQPAQPEPQQPASPSATSPSEQAVPPQEHLRQAKAAVDSITTASVPAKSRAKLAQLKRHLSDLEKAASEPTAQATTAPQPAGTKDSWGKDVAAIDKIITEMVGDQTTGAVSPGASTPGATGTSGSSKADDAVAVDEATRAKLMEVRTHITAFAAGMAGSSAPKTDAAATPSNSPAPQEQPSSAAAAPPASPGQSPAPTAGEPAPTAPAAQQPGAAAQEPGAPAQEAGAAQAQIDADAARRHLMAARESLSQITQLPAAGQLTGEARTQVAQLISNFNELITTQSNWRASYAKVDANLTALIGAENGDAEAAAATQAPTAPAPGAPAPGAEPPTAQPPTGTPGSVGTSGSATVEVDPAIRAKLVELRQHLAQFEKASGGAK